MNKVSVIVPVYNVENYLEKCIQSIISQSFKNLEIILVNDGSTDKSKEICEEFAKKDERIILLNQENQGVSAARNFGLDNCTGNYISFVDSDDYIAFDMIEFLVNNIEKNKSDISTCGHYNCKLRNGSLECSCYKNSNESGTLSSSQSLQECLIGGKLSMMPVDKLYKRHLFDDIRFPIRTFYEDSAIIPLIMTKISKVHYSFNPKYFYFRHENSITTRKFQMSNLDIIKVNKINYDMIKEKYSYALKHAEFRLFWSYLCVIDKIIYSNSSCSEFQEILNIVKKNKLIILINPFFTLKRKLLNFLLIINFTLYKKIIKYFGKRRYMFG